MEEFNPDLMHEVKQDRRAMRNVPHILFAVIRALPYVFLTVFLLAIILLIVVGASLAPYYSAVQETYAASKLGQEYLMSAKDDVVLLDLGLPDIDGEEVLVKMKELNKNAKVAILTGFGADEIKDRVLPLGPDAFFTKPCKFPEILNQIKKWQNA